MLRAADALLDEIDGIAELLVREDAPGEDGAAEGGWIAASQEPLVSPDAGQVVGRPRGVGRLR